MVKHDNRETQTSFIIVPLNRGHFEKGDPVPLSPLRSNEFVALCFLKPDPRTPCKPFTYADEKSIFASKCRILCLVSMRRFVALCKTVLNKVKMIGIEHP